jgi:hypothetical protein
MMKIAFTQNNLPLSRLIRWADGETVSHVVIVFDDKYVFQSNLYGVHIMTWEHFQKANKIMALKSYDLGLVIEEECFQSIVPIEGDWYDFGALLFWGLAVFRKKFFKTSLPKKNLWASDKFYTCVEVLRMMPKYIWPENATDEVRNAEYTPGEVANILGATWL